MLQPLIVQILRFCLFILYWQSKVIWMCIWRGKGLNCAASRKQEQQMRIPPRGFHYMVLMKETTLWDKCPGYCLAFNPFLPQMKSYQSRLEFPRVEKHILFFAKGSKFCLENPLEQKSLSNRFYQIGSFFNICCIPNSILLLPKSYFNMPSTAAVGFMIFTDRV